MSIDSSDLRKIQKAYEKVKDAKILDYWTIPKRIGKIFTTS